MTIYLTGSTIASPTHYTTHIVTIDYHEMGIHIHTMALKTKEVTHHKRSLRACNVRHIQCLYSYNKRPTRIHTYVLVKQRHGRLPDATRP